MANFISKVLLVVAALGVGFLLGRYFFNGDRCDLSQMSYINQKLNCDKNYVINKANYDNLENSLKDYIDKSKKQGIITKTGIYFRDLENGPTMSIDSKDNFIPASLLKLPTAMAYYKLAEQKNNDNIFDSKIGYRQSGQTEVSEFEQIFPPAESSEPDKLYSIRDLIYYSLAQSDNKATETLIENLKGESGDNNINMKTFEGLGLSITGDASSDDISPQDYSSLFRQLYNASYLSDGHSNEVLSVLARSSFTRGLVSGVPKEIQVAHKFGERFGLQNNEKQLHDCGIIYYPKNPYILCVMTRGYNYQDLSKFIGTVSKMVYEEVDSRKI